MMLVLVDLCSDLARLLWCCFLEVRNKLLYEEHRRSHSRSDLSDPASFFHHNGQSSVHEKPTREGTHSHLIFFFVKEWVGRLQIAPSFIFVFRSIKKD